MKKFARWVRAQDKSYTELAKLLRCSRQRISNIINQDHRPSMALALRIHEASKGAVPFTSWRSK